MIKETWHHCSRFTQEAWQLSHHQNDKGAASHRFWRLGAGSRPVERLGDDPGYRIIPRFSGRTRVPIEERFGISFKNNFWGLVEDYLSWRNRINYKILSASGDGAEDCLRWELNED